MKTKNQYRIPIDMNHVTDVQTDSIAHVNGLEHAIDYDAPEGVEVLAAQDGVVLSVKDDSDRGGDDSSFEDDGNYIELLHDHEEVSEYEHLLKDSACVRVGDTVTQGQVIAKVGNTGWTECSHLHFMVYPKGRENQTLEIQFEE